MPKDALDSFNILKKDIVESVVCDVDESKPFVVETDASDFAIAATLSQGGRPVAFFSRTPGKGQIDYHPVEKEAHAIIEAIRYWRHLSGKHFRLITDQKSVSFMFNSKCAGKVKNDKIQCWRLELASYNFDISYRPGAENIPADTFTRLYCSSISLGSLNQLHISLCHPGIRRLSSCQVCAGCKPKYYKSPNSHLIKVTQPFVLALILKVHCRHQAKMYTC